MKIRRRLALGAAAAALALGGMLVAAVPAVAATPPGGGDGPHAQSVYDGSDPAVTGCSADARVIYQHALLTPSGATTAGLMQIEYSPSCGTNWVRSYWPNASDVQWKSIERDSDGYGVVSDDYYAGWTYTYQVWAPGCVAAQASIGAAPLPGATPIASWSVDVC